MRFPIVLLAVTAATASVIQERGGISLPFSAFEPHKAHMISYEDALSGADLANKSTSSNNRVGSLMFTSAAAPQSASAASCAQNPNIRYEWRQYSQSDRLAFVAAIKCLINKPSAGAAYAPSTNRFEDFARVHQRFTPNIHGNPKFLVWHRYFLWTFEQTLRRECGFNRAMVWWDETKDAGQFSQSDMFTNNAYFGRLSPAVNGQPLCVTTGAFAGLTAHIGPGQGSGAHCLSRAVDESLTAQCNTNFVNACNSRSSYADMESCAEGGPHAYGHNGIGAVMSDVSASPSDPIFYMHHTFVDHGFRLWQNLAASRVSTINGNDAQGNPLTLNTLLDVGGLGPTVPISAVMNTLSGTVINGAQFCYKYTY